MGIDHEWWLSGHPFLLAQDDAAPGIGPANGGGGGGGAVEGVTPANGAPPTSAQPAPGFPWWFWVPILLMFVFLIWSSSASQRKEKKRRDAMLAGLRRHDRVQTIGGVIGSVVEVKDQEVVVKVDETNNIKMRFARSAIQQVLSEGSESAKSEG
ncbi:MAG: preprotein translocase subunit YajC [Phycisphaerales bacterium]